jgi:hypothetical protein
MDLDVHFIRKEEAAELVRLTADPTTKKLMIAARYTLGRVVHIHEIRPISEFDLLFLMEFLQVFCGDHELLRRILDGEEIGL